MGLLRRKKEAIERFRKENTYAIACLHCFKRFGHDMVMFRALEALDADGYTAQYDDELDSYRYRFGLDTAGELEAALDPADFDESRKKYHKGILMSLTDDYGNITTKRLCPFCHNELHPSAGFSPSIIFSIAGSTRAGKSVFFTSLIHQLRNKTSKHFPSFCVPINNEVGRTFKHGLVAPMIENGILPISALLKEFPDAPLVFSFSLTEGDSSEVHIVFFDPAGDSLCLDLHNDLMKSSSGVMMLVDPLGIPYFGRDLAEKSDPDFDPLFFTEPADDLGIMLLEHAKNIPAAVVLTKTDLLKSIIGESELFDDLSAVFEDFRHSGLFDVSEFSEIDSEISVFFEEECPHFYNAMKKRFGSDLGFFGVSALGEKPNAGQVSQINPVRVDEPFLWLLYKMGLIMGEDE